MASDDLAREVAAHRTRNGIACLACGGLWPCTVARLADERDEWKLQAVELAGIEDTALAESERANKAEAALTAAERRAEGYRAAVQRAYDDRMLPWTEYAAKYGSAATGQVPEMWLGEALAAAPAEPATTGGEAVVRSASGFVAEGPPDGAER